MVLSPAFTTSNFASTALMYTVFDAILPSLDLCNTLCVVCDISLRSSQYCLHLLQYLRISADAHLATAYNYRTVNRVG